MSTLSRRTAAAIINKRHRIGRASLATREMNTRALAGHGCGKGGSQTGRRTHMSIQVQPQAQGSVGGLPMPNIGAAPKRTPSGRPSAGVVVRWCGSAP
jgi:hypothetical protein